MLMIMIKQKTLKILNYMKGLNRNLQIKKVADATGSIIATTAKYPNDGATKSLLDEVAAARDIVVEVAYTQPIPMNIKSFEKRVNRLFRMMYHLTEAYLNSDDHAMQSAAKTVKSVISQHKNFVNQSYMGKAAAVDMLMQDLTSDRVRPSMEAIPGMGSCAACFAEAGKAMAAQRDIVLVERSNNKPAVSLMEAKRQLLDIVNNRLVEHLYQLSLIDPSKFKQQHEEVMGIISQYNGMYHIS